MVRPQEQAMGATGVLDTGSTGFFITEEGAKEAGLPILGPSTKAIAVANDEIAWAKHKTRLPYDLPASMMEGDVVPKFSHSLVGVKPFADAGCISVFHPHQEGVTIHQKEDVKIEFLAPPIVQGVRDESGL